jgi:carbon-monoxide dehydrogenase medium subunit
MIPAECDYYRADSVGEALDLLEAHADRDPELIAGGHGLVPDMKIGEASPGVLVDIDGVEGEGLRSIEADAEGLTVGALARHADVAESPILRENALVLAETAENVGDVQIRNRGTLGGNLAEADPAADLPAAVLAADATLELASRDGERTVPAGEFFHGNGETALESDEIITHVRVPRGPGTEADCRAEAGRKSGAYAKKTHPASGYAMVGVAARVAVEGGVVSDARVAATGVADRATRLATVEERLAGQRADDEASIETAAETAAESASEDLDSERLVGDAYASGEFRAQLLSAYARRALETALDRATGEGSPTEGSTAEGLTDEDSTGGDRR